jgi:hypothetical protein
MVLTPTIDYTDKDFQSLRRAMLDLARYRLPEWTDQSPSDLGALLVDLFAYMGDIILYYQDRIANESFLATAVERRSVLHALRLIGYELTPPVPAAVELTLYFKRPPAGSSTVVTIPAGTPFISTANVNGAPQTFEYVGADLTIDLASDQVTLTADNSKLIYQGLPALQVSLHREGQSIGRSTGEPNQMFAIADSPVILDSLVVEVNEGSDANPSWKQWDRRASLLYDVDPDGRVRLSGPDARDYYVQFDENDTCWVQFGDGVYGRRPPAGADIRASYRVGGGSEGNVVANSITNVDKGLFDSNTKALFDSVTNPKPAAGGADHEDIEHAKRFGPLAFRAAGRAVTLQDYIVLAQQAGGVAKVRGIAPSGSVVELYVAPEGDSCRPVPEALRRRLTAYFDDKRMAGTVVEVKSASCVLIDIGIELEYDKRYHADAVRQAAESAVQDLLAFKNVDFGQSLYLSDVYGRVEAVAGVSAMTVTRFRRQDSPTAQIADQLQQLGLPAVASIAVAGGGTQTIDVAGLLRRVAQIEVGTNGHIDIKDFEIPALGKLEIDLTESTR